MSQLNLYLPSDLEKAVKAHAKKSGKSLSHCVADLIRSSLMPIHSQNRQDFDHTFGAWVGDFERPIDPPLTDEDFGFHQSKKRK